MAHSAALGTEHIRLRSPHPLLQPCFLILHPVMAVVATRLLRYCTWLRLRILYHNECNLPLTHTHTHTHTRAQVFMDLVRKEVQRLNVSLVEKSGEGEGNGML